MSDVQAFLCGTLKERVAHDHSKGAFAHQGSHTVDKRDHFAEPRPALVALEQMDLDGLLFGLANAASQ